MKTKILILVLALGLGLGVTASSADTVNIAANTAQSSDSTPLAAYTGKLIYTDTNATSAKLEVDLTWTNINGSTMGFLTALALNNPNNDITNVSMNAFPANFRVIAVGGPFNNNGVAVQPFGNADFGASITSDWQGGGSPNGGAPSNTEEAWIFNLTGTNLNTLTVNSFVNELTVGPGIGGGAQFFVASFRGFDNGGVDKEPGQVGQVVPIPPTALLLGTGILGLVALGWRRKKTQ